MQRGFIIRAVYAALLGICAVQLAAGQMSEEEKKALFLKARQDIRPVPKKEAAPTPPPKPRPAATPIPRPQPTPRPQPSPTPAPPRPVSTPEPEEDVSQTPPPPKEEPTPSKPAPTPTPAPDTPVTGQKSKGKTPAGEKLDAPVVIEKSGLSDEQGYEPPKKSTGGLFKRWRYLTPAVRKAIDNAPVRKGRWKYIIVHNSGTRQGNARIFDNYHRRVRKMENGLAYHFVIGNGNASGDGQIEIGPRWTKQINGGHVASDYLNNIALGICLVGDLNRDAPTKAQLEALDELIVYLRGRVGKVKGKTAIVKGHKEINPKPTDCPGDRFPLKWLRRRFGS